MLELRAKSAPGWLAVRLLDAELSECIEDRIAALGNNVPPDRGDFGGELGLAHMLEVAEADVDRPADFVFVKRGPQACRKSLAADWR
jgi:hypothetical protein